MAITIEQGPEYGASAHEALIHVLSRSAPQPAYRYIFEVYINAVSVALLKIAPDPSNSDLGTVDLSRIVRSYLGHYFEPTVDAGKPYLAIDTPKANIAYDVHYGEEYLTGGTITTILDMDIAGYNAWNGYPLEYPGARPGEVFPNTYAYGWLTDRVGAIYTADTGHCFMPYYHAGVPGHTFKVRIQVYDAAGSVISTITSTAYSLTGPLMVFDISPAAIALFSGVVLSSLAWVRYVVTILHGVTSAAMSDPLIVYPRGTGKVAPGLIHFMNRTGGFETAVFEGVTRSRTTFERKTYQQRGVGRPVLPGSALSYYPGGTYRANFDTKTYYESATVYSNQHATTLTFNSGPLTDAENNWLHQLLATPEAYYERDGYLYPLAIKTDKWSYKGVRHDKVYFLELEADLSFKRHSQYR